MHNLLLTIILYITNIIPVHAFSPINPGQVQERGPRAGSPRGKRMGQGVAALADANHGAKDEEGTPAVAPAKKKRARLLNRMLDLPPGDEKGGGTGVSHASPCALVMLALRNGGGEEQVAHGPSPQEARAKSSEAKREGGRHTSSRRHLVVDILENTPVDDAVPSPAVLA